MDNMKFQLLIIKSYTPHLLSFTNISSSSAIRDTSSSNWVILLNVATWLLIVLSDDAEASVTRSYKYYNIQLVVSKSATKVRHNDLAQKDYVLNKIVINSSKWKVCRLSCHVYTVRSVYH